VLRLVGVVDFLPGVESFENRKKSEGEPLKRLARRRYGLCYQGSDRENTLRRAARKKSCPLDGPLAAGFHSIAYHSLS
jgi:hypothetical protein